MGRLLPSLGSRDKSLEAAMWKWQKSGVTKKLVIQYSPSLMKKYLIFAFISGCETVTFLMPDTVKLCT